MASPFCNWAAQTQTPAISRRRSAPAARQSRFWRIRDRVVRDVYGFDFLLLRPDLHIVWRGNQPPEDADEVAAIATGHGPR